MNNLNRISVCMVVTSILFIPVVCAEGFEFFGPRAMAMGGAYTAIATDPAAVYWNPSLILDTDQWNIAWISNKATFEKSEFEDDIQDTLQLTPDSVSGSTEQTEQLAAFLKALDKSGTSATKSENTSFAVQHKAGALMIIERENYYVTPAIDMTNIDSAPDSATSITNNTSHMQLTALKRTEIISSFSYISQQIGVRVGINLKYVMAKSNFQDFSLWDLPANTTSTKLFDQSDDGYREEAKKFSWDVGITAMIGSGRLSLMGKDISGYKLDREDGPTIEIRPSYRIGYAMTFPKQLTTGIDYDVSSNRFPFSDESDRKFAWGFEKWFGGEKAVAVRGGLSRGLTNYNNEFVFTGGAGVKLKWFLADIGAIYDNEKKSSGINMQVLISF